MLGVIPQSIRGPDCQDYFLQSFSVFFTGTGCKFPNMTCAVANAAVLPYVWEAKYMEHSNPLGLEDIFGPKNWSTFDLSLSHSHQRWSSQRSRGRLGENGRSLFHDSVWLHVRATGMVEDEQGKNGDGHMWPTVPFNLLHGCARTSSQRSTIYSLTKMEATNGILKCMFHLVYQNRTGPWQYGKGVSHRTGGQVSMESCHIGPLDLWMFFGSKFRDWMKSPVSGPWSMCLRSFQWHQIC